MKFNKNRVYQAVILATAMNLITAPAIAKETVINIDPEIKEKTVVQKSSTPVEQVVVVAEVKAPKQRVEIIEKETAYNGTKYVVEEEKVVTDKYAMNSDEHKLLHEKEFLDPNQDIVATRKKFEQNIEKILPDEIKGMYSFFNPKPSNALSERMYIDERDGLIYYRVKHGTLRSNVVDLMAETRNTKHLVWKVGAHKVYSDYWVTGKSMFEVMNNMLTPYKQPEQIYFGIFNGETIAIFYENQQEFWN